MVYNLKITWLGYFILIVILNSCTSKYEILSLESGVHEIIPSTKNLNNQSTQEDYNLEIISKYEEVEIKVLDSTRTITQRGFGLNGGKKVIVRVNEGEVLTIKNDSPTKLAFRRLDINKSQVKKDLIPLTLVNSSNTPIPLIIPGVMNPNLSPQSRSGVALELGQKIFYKKGLKKILLLQVDGSFKPNTSIHIDRLLK